MGAPTIGPRDDRPGRMLYADAESNLGRIVEPGVQAVIWLAGERPPWLAEVAVACEDHRLRSAHLPGDDQAPVVSGTIRDPADPYTPAQHDWPQPGARVLSQRHPAHPGTRTPSLVCHRRQARRCRRRHRLLPSRRICEGQAGRFVPAVQASGGLAARSSNRSCQERGGSCLADRRYRDLSPPGHLEATEASRQSALSDDSATITAEDHR
jgi:hypothetical protein